MKVDPLDGWLSRFLSSEEWPDLFDFDEVEKSTGRDEEDVFDGERYLMESFGAVLLSLSLDRRLLSGEGDR